MADQLILDLTGIELELRVVRNTDTPLLVTIVQNNGTALDLDGFDVTMTVVDRVGGTTKFTATNAAGTHANDDAGQTRFVVTAASYSGLTGNRTYTWKYQIIVRDIGTNQKYRAFWGDFRVLASPATV